MFTHRPNWRTLVDALPHARAKDLKPGDMVAHRGRVGHDEAGGRPVIRIENGAEEGRVRIIQPFLDPRHKDEETALGAGAEQLIAVLPPYWPTGVTRELTDADVTAAREHVGARAVETSRP